MAGKEESKRRINLTFDDLEQDILIWLNTFGKRKRAKVAKAAIRKAMVEGQTASSLLNSAAAQSDLFKNPMPTSNREALPEKQVQGKEAEGHEQKGSQASQETIEMVQDENLMSLLGLTGSEENEEILKLI
jgi:hypothetical protein